MNQLKATLLLLYVGAKFQHILFAGHFKLVGEPKILHLHLKTTMKKKVRSLEASPNQQCWVTLFVVCRSQPSGLCRTCPCLHKLCELLTSPFLPLLHAQQSPAISITHMRFPRPKGPFSQISPWFSVTALAFLFNYLPL